MTDSTRHAESDLPCDCTYWSGGSSSYLMTCPCGISGYCSKCGKVFSWFDQRYTSRHPTECDGISKSGR